MKNLHQAFVLGVTLLAGSTAFAASTTPGASAGGQAIALNNLNTAITSGTINGFYYAGGNSSPSSPAFAGGGAPGPFVSSFIPSAPTQPNVGSSSLLVIPSNPAFLPAGNGGGGSNGNNSNSNGNNSNSNGNANGNGGFNGNSNSNSNGSSGGGSNSGSGTTLPGVTTFSAPLAPQSDAPSVPDNGTTLLLLGVALTGLAFVRRKLRV